MAGELLTSAERDSMADTAAGSFWDTFTVLAPSTTVDEEGNVAGAPAESAAIACRYAVHGMDGATDELLVADQPGQQVDATITFARGAAVEAGQTVLVADRGRFTVHRVLDSRVQARALLRRVDG